MHVVERTDHRPDFIALGTKSGIRLLRDERQPLQLLVHGVHRGAVGHIEEGEEEIPGKAVTFHGIGKVSAGAFVGGLQSVHVQQEFGSEKRIGRIILKHACNLVLHFLAERGERMFDREQLVDGWPIAKQRLGGRPRDDHAVDVFERLGRRGVVDHFYIENVTKRLFHPIQIAVLVEDDLVGLLVLYRVREAGDEQACIGFDMLEFSFELAGIPAGHSAKCFPVSIFVGNGSAQRVKGVVARVNGVVGELIENIHKDERRSGNADGQANHIDEREDHIPPERANGDQ